MAEEAGIAYYGFLSLEEVLLLGLDLLVSPEHNPARPSVAEAALDHPAMRKAGTGARSVTLPQALWSCAGPMNAAAVALLAAARP